MAKIVFGTLSNGTKVHSYVIKNETLEVTLLDYGAIVQSLKYKGVDVVLGYDDVKSYEKNDGYLGAVIGRVANRIKGGSFTLDKKTYSLYKNDGKNTLHGGKCGFNSYVWEVESSSDTEIKFKRISPNKEEGFPGNLIVGVRYYLNGGSFGIEYTAVSDKDTVVNLTNHTYFNFNGDESAENMFLSINADYFTPIDKTLIPTGEIVPVKDTPMDFNLSKFIGRDINEDFDQLTLAGGYDHNYVLKGNGFREVATLSSGRKNIMMRCFTDQSGVQFYSGNFLNGEIGKGGLVHKKRYGVCLETQSFPNAVNEKRFKAPVLKKDETYKTVTEYRFEDFMSNPIVEESKED